MDTTTIGHEPASNLERRITRELIDDPQVALMASCPANSAGHLAVGIADRVRDRVNDWMVEHLDRTGNAATFEKRVEKWSPMGEATKALVIAVANTIHAHYALARERNELAPTKPR